MLYSVSLRLMNQEKLSQIMMYKVLYVFCPLKQLTVSELRHAVNCWQFHTFVHMNISSCTTAIGSTFSVHLNVSSFPIGETPIRIDGFFGFEVLTHPLLFHLQVGEGAWLHCTLLAMHAPVSVCKCM